MDINDKVTQLEDEIKVLKNEVQAVLLDLRESYLNHENPFNPAVSPATNQPAVIAQPPPIVVQPPPAAPPIAEEEPDEVKPVESQKSEPLEAEEPAREPEPVRKQASTATETAREEVERAWRPKLEMGAQFKSGGTIDGLNGKADLITIAGLTHWVSESAKRLGRERAEAILDISEVLGHLPPDMKGILIKLIGLTPDGYSGEITTRDYLASLIELTNLLGKGNKSEAALLSILYQENGHR